MGAHVGGKQGSGGARTRHFAWVVIAVMLVVGMGAPTVGAQSPDDVVDVDFEGAQIGDVLRVLGELGGYNVIVDPSVQGAVTFRLQGMTVAAAIEMVVRTSGYSFRTIGNTLVIGPEATLRARFDDLTTRVFSLRFVEPGAIIPALQLMVPNAEVRIDAGQRALVVRGTTADLQAVGRVISERDVRPTIDQEFVDAPLLDIFRHLAAAGGYNLIVGGDVGGRLTIVLRGRSVEDAIATVARRSGVAYEIDGADLIISRPGGEQGPDQAGVVRPSEPSERRIFQLAYVGPSRLLDAVRVLAGQENVWADEAARTMIVSAAGATMQQIVALVRLLDAPEASVQGILRQGESYTAILGVGGSSYIVRPGDEIAGVRVIGIESDSVILQTVHGQQLRVIAGRK